MLLRTEKDGSRKSSSGRKNRIRTSRTAPASSSRSPAAAAPAGRANLTPPGPLPALAPRGRPAPLPYSPAPPHLPAADHLCSGPSPRRGKGRQPRRLPQHGRPGPAQRPHGGRGLPRSPLPTTTGPRQLKGAGSAGLPVAQNRSPWPNGPARPSG